MLGGKATSPIADSSVDEKKSSKVYRCRYNTEGVVVAPGAPDNLYDSLKSSAFKYGDCNALGWRPIVDGQPQAYKFMTYREFDEKVTHIGSAMKAVNVAKGASVGIYAANSPEWMLAVKGVDFCGAKTVPLYDTFGPDAVEFIIKHSGIALIFCASNKLATLTEVLPRVQAQMVQVVVWGSSPGVPVHEQLITDAEKSGVPITLWDRFEKFGESNPQEPTPSGFKEICTIMYTSGTTGDPKGVEITHEAILTSAGALFQLMDQFGVTVGTSDVFLSYLTLAHIFGRVAEETFMALGGSIGYWQGSPKTLLDDVAALRPTIFVGVPRIFDRIYTGVTQKVAASKPHIKFIFKLAFKIKELFLRMGRPSVPIIDNIAFSKVKASLGGRVRLVVSGGAPLANHVEHFLKVTMCAPVTQAYGLTETCGASFMANPYSAAQARTVGAPVAALDVRLESIPEMGYDSTTEPIEGEVCLRGPAVFSGYHRRPDLTEKDYYDGWFHTGDVGRFMPDGSLKIIDRKKNFFKLAHGEYVAAEKLENEYKKCTIVDQIWVYGDSEQAYLVAVVVPNYDLFVPFAAEKGIRGTNEDLCMNTTMKGEVQKVLETAGRTAGMKGFEIVKQVYLFPEAFSTENDLMTPSFKLKRPQLKKYFAREIAAMYSPPV